MPDPAIPQHALDLLRQAELADAYEEAWDEWDSSGEAQLWETVLDDGLQSTGGC